MKKITFLITLLLLCLVAFPQQYFSKGFVSNGDGNFLSGTKLTLSGYYIRHSSDSVWLEKPLGTWVAPISNPATVVIDTLTKIATKYDLDTLSKSILDSAKLVTKADLRNGNNLGDQISFLSESGEDRYSQIGFFPSASILRLGVVSPYDANEVGYRLDSAGLSAYKNYASRNTSNPRWIPDKEYVDDAIGGVSITETDPIYAADSNTLVRWLDTTAIIATKADLIETVETTSRTIYVSTTGDDETGNGATLGTAFRNILKALQDIKDRAEGVTITISLNGTGDFPITYAEMYELGKKTFINSSLIFTGVDYTTIESGFTTVKTASRCYAYTLTKSGLIATENQYRGNFVRTAAGIYYPIAYNAAGTNSFEIEYVNRNAVTTSIIEFGVTITNPSNLEAFLDLNFRLNINSIIQFTKVNINGGSTVALTLVGNTTQKNFLQCKFLVKTLQLYRNLLSAQNTNQYTSVFEACSFIGQGNATLINLRSGRFIIFLRCFGLSANTTGGAVNLQNSTDFTLNDFYIYSTVTGSYAFKGMVTPAIVNQVNFFKAKDYTGIFYISDNFQWTLANAQTTVSAPTVEFTNVTNLFKFVPRSNVSIAFTGLYGSLPTVLIEGVTSGYKFVDPENDIHISIPGIYGEFETHATAPLADNSSGAITVGDITQNESVKIEYKINRGTSEEVGTIVMTKKADTNLSDISYFDDCGVSFTKSLVGNAITLNWATTSTGTAATIKYSITRIML